MRSVLGWILLAVAAVLALPAQLLMHAAEVLGDWSDEFHDN